MAGAADPLLEMLAVPDGYPPVTGRVGTVTAVSPLVVTLTDGTVLDSPKRSGAAPTLGQRVPVLMFGTSPLVLPAIT